MLTTSELVCCLQKQMEGGMFDNQLGFAPLRKPSDPKIFWSDEIDCCASSELEGDKETVFSPI